MLPMEKAITSKASNSNPGTGVVLDSLEVNVSVNPVVVIVGSLVVAVSVALDSSFGDAEGAVVAVTAANVGSQKMFRLSFAKNEKKVRKLFSCSLERP